MMRISLPGVVVAVIALAGAGVFAQAGQGGKAPAGGASPVEAPPAQAPAHGPADDHGTADAHGVAADAHGAGAHHDAGPVLPPDLHRPDTPRRRWPGVLLLLIGSMFLAAAVIGPVVRAHAPPEMPATHSHDEPPGASHHHGHGGTINPLPEDVQRLEGGHGHDLH